MEKSAVKFIWSYAKKFKLLMSCVFILLVLNGICGRYGMLYAAKLYDAVSSNATVGVILNIIIIGILLVILRRISYELGLYYYNKYVPKISTIIGNDVFAYTNKHSIAYFTEEMSGNIASKLGNLANGVANTLDDSFNFFAMFIDFFITVVLLSSLNFYFLPAFVGWFFLSTYIAIYWAGKNREASKALAKVSTETTGIVVDSVSNYSEIKSFANFKYERRKVGYILRKLRIAEIKRRMTQMAFRFSNHTLIIIGSLLFSLLALWLFKQNKIDAVGFIFAGTLFTAFADALFGIGWVYNSFTRTIGTVQASLDTLAIEPEIQDKRGALVLKAKKAHINFEDVDFCYKSKKCLFKNLNLEIKEGEKLGLVGHSGAGKSTFIKLIARYFDISNGSIKINGADIRDVTQDSLHKNISTIPQDVNLFNRTLMENIRYGNVTASDDDVIKAAQKANADEFIKNMPQGYMSKVGERGVVLSGGERQRIAIARAILKNAPILIFDEATSALDSHSEKHIQKSLKNVMKGKTVIAVAHRLSTLREMDRIVVFDKGKIVEQGSHAHLLRKKGKYYKLYNMQADGFITQ